MTYTTPSEWQGKTVELRFGPYQGLFLVAAHSKAFDDLLLQPVKLKLLQGGDKKVTKLNSTQSAQKPKIISWSVFAALPPELRAERTWEYPQRATAPFDSLTPAQRAAYMALKKRLDQVCTTADLMAHVRLDRYHHYLTNLASRLGVHRTTIARDIARLLICNQDPQRALIVGILGDRKNQKRQAPTKKRGRPNKLVATGHAPDAGRSNTSDACVAAIEAFIMQCADRNKRTMASLYREFREEFICKPIQLMDGTSVRLPQEGMNISEETFRYYVRKHEDALARAIAEVGTKKFRKDLRTLIGTAKDLIPNPGYQYIIDSTVADLYLVCVVDRRLIVGRPVIYVVMDAFSSLILAVHVSLDAPSVANARTALFRAVSSKEQTFQRLNLLDFLYALPQGCLPYSVFADRGELLSTGGRLLSEIANVVLTLAAPYRADWKGLLERYFKTQNDLAIHWIPGAVRARMAERGDRDVRLDSVMTLHGFQRLLYSLAAQWNLTHDMTRHVSGSMLRHDVQPTPLAIYQYGLEHLHASPRFADREWALMKYAPMIEATANRQGVHVNGYLRFTAAWMREDAEFYVQRQDGKVHFCHDPDVPVRGHVLDRSASRLRPVELVNTRDYDERIITIEDVQVVEEYTHLQHEELHDMHQGVQDMLAHQRKEIIDSETKATKLAQQEDTRSKTARTSAIQENRRGSQARMLQQSMLSNDAAAIATTGGSPSQTERPEDQAWSSALNDVLGEMP